MNKFENIDTTKAKLFNIPLSNEKFSENYFDDHKSLNLNAKMPFIYTMDNFSDSTTNNTKRTNSNKDSNEDSSISILENILKQDLSKETETKQIGDTTKTNIFLTKKTYMTKHQVEDEIENLYTTRSCPTGYKESELKSSTTDELLNLRKITFEYLKYRSSKTRNVQFIYLIKRINGELSDRKINTNMTMIIPEYAKTNESTNNTINSGEYTLTKKITNNTDNEQKSNNQFEDLYDLSLGDLWNNIPEKTEKKDKEKEKKFVIHTKYFSLKTKGKLQVPQLFQDNGNFERNKYKVSNDSGNVNFCGFSTPHDYFDLKNLDKLKKVQEIIINNRQKYSHMTLNTPNYSETLNSSFNKNNDLCLNENNKKSYDLNALKNSKILKEKEKKKLALKKATEIINKLKNQEEMKKKLNKGKDQIKLLTENQVPNKTFEFLGFKTYQISKEMYDKTQRKVNNNLGKGKGKGKRKRRSRKSHKNNEKNDEKTIPSTRKLFAKLFKKKKLDKKNKKRNIPKFVLIKQNRIPDCNNKIDSMSVIKENDISFDYKENMLNSDNITIVSSLDSNKSDIVMSDKFFPSSQDQKSVSTQLPLTSSNNEINSNSNFMEQENFIDYNKENNLNINSLDQVEYLSNIMKLNYHFDFSCFDYNNDNNNHNIYNNIDQKPKKNMFISNEIPHIEFANSKETMYH